MECSDRGVDIDAPLGALKEIERLRAELAKQQQATFRLCSEEESRLRDMVLGLGLDPDAGHK